MSYRLESNYKRLGDYIKRISNRNISGEVSNLQGININKYFMPSVANVIGTNLKRYKIVEPNQFACNRMHVGRDYRLPIAVSKFDNSIIVSPAYDVFKIKDENKLNVDYLMMWVSRAEFDRNCWFYTDTDIRGKLGWDSFCDMRLPIPSIEKQNEIVREYNTIVNRIELNETLNQKLEETAQALYKHWFVDFDTDETVSLKEYIETNPKLSLKRGEVSTYIEMANLSETSMTISGQIKREYKGGSRFQNNDTLIARITPCLENGKTAFINTLDDDEVAAGSTEFIVMRAKKNISVFWVYCLAKDELFRKYAISSMIGSSGRQRVQEKYLGEFKLPKINKNLMVRFDRIAKLLFNKIKTGSLENQKLIELQSLLLAKMTKVE